MLVLALCLAHVIVLLLCCWPSSDFISCSDTSTLKGNVIEMFVTSVQTRVSLLNEQIGRYCNFNQTFTVINHSGSVEILDSLDAALAA